MQSRAKLTVRQSRAEQLQHPDELRVIARSQFNQRHAPIPVGPFAAREDTRCASRAVLCGALHTRERVQERAAREWIWRMHHIVAVRERDNQLERMPAVVHGGACGGEKVGA